MGSWKDTHMDKWTDEQTQTTHQTDTQSELDEWTVGRTPTRTNGQAERHRQPIKQTHRQS